MKYRKKKTGELDLFIEIWKDRVSPDGLHKSEISGRVLDSYLDTDWFLNCFPHIIPKGGILRLTFPNKFIREKLLRLNKENIMIAHPEEHFLIDQGTEEARAKYEVQHNCDFNVFFEKKERLIALIQYQIDSGDY